MIGLADSLQQVHLAVEIKLGTLFVLLIELLNERDETRVFVCQLFLF